MQMIGRMMDRISMTNRLNMLDMVPDIGLNPHDTGETTAIVMKLPVLAGGHLGAGVCRSAEP